MSSTQRTSHNELRERVERINHQIEEHLTQDRAARAFARGQHDARREVGQRV
jgi:hypothetical protein